MIGIAIIINKKETVKDLISPILQAPEVDSLVYSSSQEIRNLY